MNNPARELGRETQEHPLGLFCRLKTERKVTLAKQSERWCGSSLAIGCEEVVSGRVPHYIRTPILGGASTVQEVQMLTVHSPQEHALSPLLAIHGKLISMEEDCTQR